MSTIYPFRRHQPIDPALEACADALPHISNDFDLWPGIVERTPYRDRPQLTLCGGDECAAEDMPRMVPAGRVQRRSWWMFFGWFIAVASITLAALLAAVSIVRSERHVSAPMLERA